ncbi:hypothetical protein EIN_155160 [Entamoeba invadens IP1]|uniref:WWE domain-containing protein n=1 Tax=Entamoeba invadens IP1 TaxID=370355 RepID=A0A0A1U945_ENTIV|nr:hypothetical protein EIN_155160 [Entamoeba invadens IP1]ELP91409.1 hypothetical protein EIN_155160 [Entamoeba invadens IP1]|eukprot:XP_004258180.1 hypothetical protein EIN_155160 [Entamoeba invadens IP1]
MGKWQWWNDKEWVDYSEKVSDLITEEKKKDATLYRADVDKERYVSVDTLQNIYQTFHKDLPDDIKGVCALQHRKDDANKVRLVREVQDFPIFKESIFFYGEKEYNKSITRLTAEVNGAQIADDYTSADYIVLPYTAKFTENMSKIVDYCKASKKELYDTDWVDESVQNGFISNTTITQKWVDLVDEWKNDQATFVLKHGFDPLEQISEEPDSEKDEGSGSENDETSNSEGNGNGFFGVPPFVASPKPDVKIIPVKNNIYEGKLTYTTLKEEYVFQMYFDGDENDKVSGMITWISLHKCQTRFEGIRKDNTLNIKETKFLRGSSFSELGEYNLVVKSANIIEGSLAGDLTAKIKVTKVVPTKRCPVLDSMDFFKNTTKAKFEMQMNLSGEVTKDGNGYVFVVQRGDKEVRIPLKKDGEDIAINLCAAHDIIKECPNSEMYETEKGIEALLLEEENVKTTIQFNEN